MQKDRKSKLAEAFMARRKKQLACYLASTLGVAITTSICLIPAIAFDVPPSSQPKTVHTDSVSVGSVGVGSVGAGSVGAGSVGSTPIATGPIAHAKADNQQAGNSDALKRVGIRFVAPESQAKLNTLGKAKQATQQTPNVIQPPMVIASPGAIANAQGSSESSVGGIRIRIPAEKPISSNAPALSANNTSSQPTNSSATSTVPSSTNLKMTVGTGVAPLPTIASTPTSPRQTPAADLKSAPSFATSSTPAAVSYGTPTTTTDAASRPTNLPNLPNIAATAPARIQPNNLTNNQSENVAPTQINSQVIASTASATPGFAIPSQTAPSFAAPATPATLNSATSNVAANGLAKPSFTTPSESKSIEIKTNEKFASQPANASKLQARLLDNSPMTSRTPGIVRIPSMVVTGAGSSTTELPPTAASVIPRKDNSFNATANLAAAMSLPTPGFIGSGSALELPMLDTAQSQMMQSRAPSIESRSLKQTSTHSDVSSAPTPAAIRSNSGFQSLPSTIPQPANLSRVTTAVNAESLAQTASRSIELAEKAIGPTPASSTPKLITATARTNPRYETSIIPVALSSSAPRANATTGINNQVDASAGSAEQAYAEQTYAGQTYADNSIAEQKTSNSQALVSMPSPVAGPATSTILVALKNVQIIRLPGKVSQVEIEDDTVCRVISTEPDTLTIIGASIGESKIKVWSTNPMTKADETQDFKISVRETWGQAAKNTVSIDDVNQSIAALFPGSSIVIKSNSDGSISVQGSAPSNESAKQILMLVRKMFLVPVQDRIAIANL
ncbi:MAG: pilus assembly protein N-terminal domain-containing protein [Planctomycetota bacterium]|nr:pilus assembly protein N-terminal domain-containing protein [Planctomycetota bacterium]